MTTDDDTLQALEEMTRPLDTGNEALVPSGQRLCPICGQVMQVEDYRGINIDFCAAHGVWLDNGEFQALLGRARASNTVPRLDAVRQARFDGKVAGMVFGGWSLLMP